MAMHVRGGNGSGMWQGWQHEGDGEGEGQNEGRGEGRLAMYSA